MAYISLFRFRTVVVGLVCGVVFGILGAPGSIYANQNSNTRPDFCSQALIELAGAKAKFDACAQKHAQCAAQRKTCEELGAELGKALVDADPEDDSCPTLDKNRYCKEDAGRDRREARERKTDSTRDLRDSRRDRDSAADKLLEAQKQASEAQMKLMEKQLEQQRQFEDKSEQRNKQLKEDIKGMKANQAKAVQDMQKSLQQIDIDYLKMREELRKAAYSINNLELTWKVRCKVAADEIAREVEKAWDERMAKEDALGTGRYNVAFTAAAGRRNRRLKQKRDKIVESYNVMLSKCLAGEREPGATLKTEIDKKRWEFQAAQEAAQDRSKVLEQQRAQIYQNMEQLQKTLGEEQAEALQTFQTESIKAQQRLQQDQQMIAQQAEQQRQNAMMAQAAAFSRVQNMDTELEERRSDQAIASRHYQCISKQETAGSKTDNEEDNKLLREGLEAGNKVRALCHILEGGGALCSQQRNSRVQGSSQTAGSLCAHHRSEDPANRAAENRAHPAGRNAAAAAVADAAGRPLQAGANGMPTAPTRQAPQAPAARSRSGNVNAIPEAPQGSP